jgi:hypothetical protein
MSRFRRNARADCAHQKACKYAPSRERLKGFEPSTFCMASRRWVCHGPAKCLQTSAFRQAKPRTGVPRIVRRYRGFRQGTDNERSQTLGGSAGSHVAVECAPASTVREPDSCCSSRRRPLAELPRLPIEARGSTSACPQEQQRRASRFSAGRHLCLVRGESVRAGRRDARIQALSGSVERSRTRGDSLFPPATRVRALHRTRLAITRRRSLVR